MANVESKFIDVLGSKMHYIESGSGRPILFLHGMPTSSYLWRHVMPHVSSLGRCIAPDLIGCGKSDKPDINYTLEDHISYIENFIQAMKLQRLTIVMHGFGSIPGLSYALNNQKNTAGLIFYEAFIRPMSGENASLPYIEQTTLMQSRLNHDESAQNAISLVEEAISQAMMTRPNAEIMSLYREPYAAQNSSKPLVRYLNEAPHGDGNSNIDKCLESLSSSLVKSSIPKLLLYSVPGFITTMATIMWAKSHLSNLEVIDVGEELHLGQESNPVVIGEAISVWLQGVEQSRSESR